MVERMKKTNFTFFRAPLYHVIMPLGSMCILPPVTWTRPVSTVMVTWTPFGRAIQMAGLSDLASLTSSESINYKKLVDQRFFCSTASLESFAGADFDLDEASIKTSRRAQRHARATPQALEVNANCFWPRAQPSLACKDGSKTDFCLVPVVENEKKLKSGGGWDVLNFGHARSLGDHRFQMRSRNNDNVHSKSCEQTSRKHEKSVFQAGATRPHEPEPVS